MDLRYSLAGTICRYPYRIDRHGWRFTAGPYPHSLLSCTPYMGGEYRSGILNSNKGSWFVDAYSREACQFQAGTLARLWKCACYICKCLPGSVCKKTLW